MKMIEYENLKLVNSSFIEKIKKDFEETLESGWYILGNKVVEFEKKFAEFINIDHCIGVASGLDALNLSLKALNYPEKSEIIAPSNTYIATILPIIHNNLTPVLVEPDLDTYNIDPGKIEEKITPNTRAIIAVHLYGKPCDMDSISAIAEKYSLAVIEDCAQAHGAKFKNKKVGAFGDFGAFSFYPTKNLGALGDGGCITTSKKENAVLIKQLRNYGSSKKYHNEIIGFNSRLDEIQAGFLLIKLKMLDNITAHKRKLAQLYFDNLKSDFIKPNLDVDYFDVFHIFNIRHPKRDDLKEYLQKNGIKTEIHYPIPPNKQKALMGYFDGESYPISEAIHNTTLSLPVSYCHKESDILKAIEVLNKF